MLVFLGWAVALWLCGKLYSWVVAVYVFTFFCGMGSVSDIMKNKANWAPTTTLTIGSPVLTTRTSRKRSKS